MITLLDCIYREGQIIKNIIDKREETFKEFMDYMGDSLDSINEIIFIGSGTSNTCSVTASRLVEKISHISTTAMLPNEFLSKKSYNEKALYVFVSQSGTSTLTRESFEKVKGLGFLNIAITESEETPLAKEVDAHIDMGCGYEEYGMRTIGYVASVFTEVLMAITIAKKKGLMDDEEIEALVEEALLISKRHSHHCDNIIDWFNKNKDGLMDLDAFVFYGSESLWGVAIEGALKTLEIAKRFMCVGYEMDDGLHGPTMGFTDRHGIIILNDGGKDNHLATSLAKFVKNEKGPGYMIGKNTIDNKDFGFETISDTFKFLEFAPVVQILAYRLAVDYGIVLKDMKSMFPLPESKYFNTHDE